MLYSSQIKSVSYLKANTAEVLALLAENRTPMIITQNGDAKAVIQDVVSFEQTQESLALLKILALGQKQVEAGEVTDVDTAMAKIKVKAKAKAKAQRNNL